MEIGSPDWNHLITDSARSLDIDMNSESIERFACHARELLHWNRRINLTSITDPAEVAIKHYLDSILPVKWISPDGRLLDVGSGGGFPGIPLKILLPKLSVTLIDSVRKKVSFQKHVIRTLALRNIEARHIRLEHFKPDVPFDVIVSRAFSPLEKFVPSAATLLAEGGSIIALKGRYAEALAESEQMMSTRNSAFFQETAGGLPDITFEQILLPPTQAERTLVVIKIS